MAARGARAIEEEEQLIEQQTSESLTRPVDKNLENIVQLSTWREVLLDMVAKNELDPWNIDLADVTNKYLVRIQKLKMSDLRIPANLILAAAILLRFKSDMISFDEPQQPLLDDYMEPISPDQIPTLELRARIPPKGRVTIDELVAAMQKVFEEQKLREEKAARKSAAVFDVPAQIEIKMSEFNIDTEIKLLLEKIGKRLDSEGLVTFSGLLDKKDRTEVVYTFLPLLFLANEGKVSLGQDPFFGEIFIRLREKEKAGETKKKEAE